MEKETMTVNELMEYLHISRSKAYELVHADGFPSFRIGKKVLISKSSLSEWIKKQENK